MMNIVSKGKKYFILLITRRRSWKTDQKFQMLGILTLVHMSHEIAHVFVELHFGNYTSSLIPMMLMGSIDSIVGVYHFSLLVKF